MSNNISMIRGESRSFRILLPQETEGAVFAEGDTLYFTVKREWSDAETALQVTVTAFADDKTAELVLIPEDTAGMEIRADGYIYDTKLVREDGNAHYIIPPSRFDLLPEVTRNE